MWRWVLGCYCFVFCTGLTNARAFRAKTFNQPCLCVCPVYFLVPPHAIRYLLRVFRCVVLACSLSTLREREEGGVCLCVHTMVPLLCCMWCKHSVVVGCVVVSLSSKIARVFFWVPPFASSRPIIVLAFVAAVGGMYDAWNRPQRGRNTHLLQHLRGNSFWRGIVYNFIRRSTFAPG